MSQVSGAAAVTWPAPERNKGPILEVLRQVLPPSPTVLEVASGTGQHAAWFCSRWPELVWQPTDLDECNLASIAAWVEQAGLPHLHPPFRLDATDPHWPVDRVDAVFNANMIHIAPWQAALGLLDGASRVLASGGPLVVYGPYRRSGRHTSPSNEAFDRSLQERNPLWGVRDLEVLTDEAERRDLVLDHVVDMPAHNLTVVFRRR